MIVAIGLLCCISLAVDELPYSPGLVALAQDVDILVCDSGAIPYSQEPAQPGQRGTQRDRQPAPEVRSGERRGTRHEPAHASVDEIARMAAESGAAKLVLVHFRPGTVDEAATVTAMREIYGGEIIFAEDMQAIRP